MAFVLDPSDPLAAGLEGYWLLDSLGPQEDLSGNNRTLRFVSNGVLNSTTYMSLVQPPSTVAETGVTAAVRCATRTAGFVIEPGTPAWDQSAQAISFWFNSSAIPDEGYLFASNRTGWGNGANTNGLSLFAHGTNDPFDGRLRTYSEIGTLATMSSALARVRRETWQHVVITMFAGTTRWISVSGVMVGVSALQMQFSEIMTPRMINANWNGIGSVINNTNVRNSSIASWSNLAIWSRSLSWQEMVRLYLEPLDMFGVVTPAPSQQHAAIIT